MELLCQLVKHWDKSQSAYYAWRHPDSGRDDYIQPPGRVPEFDDQDRLALLYLFQRSWFERLWVVQEVVLSSSAEVIWQNFRIPWKVVGLAAATLRKCHDSIVRSLNLTQIYHIYLMFRLSHHGDLKPVDLSFLHSLRLTTSFVARERKDTIFALLGIHTKDHDPQLAPLVRADYTLGYYGICTLVATTLATNTPLPSLPLDFLVNAGRQASVLDSQSDVPSWVPIWGCATSSMLSPWSTTKTWSPSKGL